MTKEQVLAIQKDGIDWFGWPLRQDGDYGPKTQWWEGISTLSNLRQETLRVSLGHHAAGMGEIHGNSIQNDGAFVEMLFKPTPWLKNAPWCIALVSHVCRKVGVPWPKYHTSAWQVIEWARQMGYIVDEPLPGDVYAFLYPKKPGDTQHKGHGGFVIGTGEVEGKKYLAVSDGNVGDACRVGRRLWTEDKVFIRVPELGTQHGKLTMPNKLMRLDSVGDR